ncbi:MAG: type I methionyl aminopeptidase [Eubacteriales bacterium]|nr:type I methionyl aminopeptidase [Eubacteriales bacterium]
MITIKTPAEIALMREAGRLTAQAMEAVSALICEGISTKELDKCAEDYIITRGGKPSFKGYQGYPGSICASVNDEVVHGIPGSRKLRQGDIISIDMGAIFHGFQGDMARTFAVGQVTDEATRLIAVTKECFEVGMAQARIGNRIGDIGHAVQVLAEGQGYGVVRDLCGHGIGQEMHEDPEVPNFGRAGHGLRLKEGMVLAIEPMINTGTWQVEFLDDGWTVVTGDGGLSGHYENTVAITADGPQILTAL